MTRPLTPDRRALAERFVPQAMRIALRIAKQSRAFHDADIARSAALEATTEAAANYDPSSGVSFEGYAWKRVAGEVLDALRKERRHWSAVRLGCLDAAAFVGDPSDVLTDSECETIGHVDALVDEVMAAAFLSFAGEIWQRQGEPGLIAREAHARALATLDAALSELDGLDSKLIALRYREGLVWQEVAASLGISERTAKRRDHQIRRRLASFLRTRSVRGVSAYEERAAQEHA